MRKLSTTLCLSFFVLILSIVQVYGYIAYIELELLSFRVLDRDTIAEGSKCDDDHINGAWNLCDFVFYVRNCSRVENTYECTTRIDRFYAPENTDYAEFDYPRPATGVTVEGAPKEMVFNITVYDQDEGRSADDFIGNYLLRVTPDLIFRQDSRLVGMTEQIITIPRHSELKLRWRAYCGDTDCRLGMVGNLGTGPNYLAGGVGPQAANFVNAALPPNFNRGIQNLAPQNQWGQPIGLPGQINPALFQPGAPLPGQQFSPLHSPVIPSQFPIDPTLQSGFVQPRFSPVQVRSVSENKNDEKVSEKPENSEIHNAASTTATPGEEKEKQVPRFVPFHWRNSIPDIADKKNLPDLNIPANNIPANIIPSNNIPSNNIPSNVIPANPPDISKDEHRQNPTTTNVAHERVPSPGTVPAEEIRWPADKKTESDKEEKNDKEKPKSGEKATPWANIQPERVDALYKKVQEISR